MVFQLALALGVRHVLYMDVDNLQLNRKFLNHLTTRERRIQITNEGGGTPNGGFMSVSPASRVCVVAREQGVFSLDTAILLYQPIHTNTSIMMKNNLQAECAVLVLVRLVVVCLRSRSSLSFSCFFVG